MQNEVSATESPGAKGFRLENEESSSALGDFTTTWSVIPSPLLRIGSGGPFGAEGNQRVEALSTFKSDHAVRHRMNPRHHAAL
jgi:hypothetical protein